MHPSNSKENKQLFSPKQNMQDHSKTLAVLQGGWGKEKRSFYYNIDKKNISENRISTKQLAFDTEYLIYLSRCSSRFDLYASSWE